MLIPTKSKDIFSLVAGPTSSGRPYLNENQFGALSISSTFLADKKTLMNWIKRTPEAIGMLREISMDVVTRLVFVALPKEKKAGRPSSKGTDDNEAKAMKFAQDNSLKQQLRAAVVEGLALGDAYLWKGSLKAGEQKEVLRKTMKDFGIDTEFKQTFLDEDPVNQRTIQYISSATMEIELNKDATSIKSFIQRTTTAFGVLNTTAAANLSSEGTIPGRTRQWDPKDILHYKFMEMDGKVHGFTPMQSSFPIIKTLGAIKQYHGNYFESGVLPDVFFNFEEMDANSPAHERMKQELAEWYNNKRRSHMVTTGKFKIDKINEWNKDMEFRMLAIYYTGVIAFSIGMPLEKIRAILGGEIKSTSGGSDIGNSDYQRKIFDMQDDWEVLLNRQFFNDEFGVNLKFERSASRDEIAEVQRDEQKLNLLQKFQQMDILKDDNLVDFAAKLFPDLPKGWFNPKPQPDLGMGMIPSSKVVPGQAQQALSDQKKQEQKPQQKNNPPTGKQIQSKELYEIDFDRFIQEVIDEKIQKESRNKIEMEDKGANVTLYISPIGINKTFKTTMTKAQFENASAFQLNGLVKPSKRLDD